MDPRKDKIPIHTRKRSHPWIDARSLELARAIAEKIRADPSLLEIARDNLARWKRNLRPWPKALEEWEKILGRSSIESIIQALVSDSEEGRRRRQSSPFTGILSQRERRDIFAKYEKMGA